MGSESGLLEVKEDCSPNIEAIQLLRRARNRGGQRKKKQSCSTKRKRMKGGELGKTLSQLWFKEMNAKLPPEKRDAPAQTDSLDTQANAQLKTCNCNRLK